MTHAHCILDTSSLQKHLEYAVLIVFPQHNGCTNATPCYVTLTLPVLLYVTSLIVSLRKVKKNSLLGYSKYDVNYLTY